MEKNQSEVGFEEKRLNETIVIAEEQLKNLLKIVEEKHHEIIESKKEVWENATHSISNLWNPDGFESLVELSQCINPVTEKIIDYEEKERMIVRLKNLIKSPYFARIDFQFEDEDVPEKVYIGRSSLTGENAWEIYIYDWRSPIGSVFYRFMTGKAFYDAPCGRIKGIVTLKRQYEIENGVLKYFFDANIPIYDKFLRQMLSENTSAKMKAIVETIQQEQDIVIRDIENDLLMVQGVAGSGKTSIALHRVAYLMYWGLQEKLSANNIIIISPNSVFKQYISNVLPELGEENVIFTVFEDILRLVLKSSDFQPRNEFLEKSLSNAPHKAVMKNSMRFKMSVEFLNILNQFIDDIPRRWILFEDVYDEGICVVDKQILKNRILDRLEIPLGMNLGHLEDYILDLVAGVGHKRKSKIEVEMVKSKIEKFTKLDVVGLYRKLFSDEAYFGELMKESCSVERIKEIWNFTRENLESDRLYYDDAIAIAYLYLKIYGTNEYREIRQVVIDEAQDYDPLQYEIFRFLFSKCKIHNFG